MSLLLHGLGNATADPELSYVGSNNTPLCKVNLAFNRSYKQGDEWKQEATYVRAQAWGKQAERLNEAAAKGKTLYVSGYLKQSTWKNEAGENRSAFVIEINEFRVCERLNGNGKNKQQSTKAPASETVPPDSSEGVDYGADNDVPF